MSEVELSGDLLMLQKMFDFLEQLTPRLAD